MLKKTGSSSCSKKEISRPIFILGCGRSGTTILGTSLSQHPDITYLNEPRDLWFKAYPETDIWTEKAIRFKGKMILKAEDTVYAKSLKLRQLFYEETVKTSRPILVEKLPINNFRLEFIHSIFPDARFIHIYRNGLEVARSIQKLSEGGSWFGKENYKWRQLVDFSKSNKITRGLPDLCQNFFYRGLLEWRLSTESVVKFLKNHSKDDFVEISYARLTNDPTKTIKKVLDFIGTYKDPSVIQFVCENISRKTNSLDNRQPSKTESNIGGDLLPLSMNNDIDGLINY